VRTHTLQLVVAALALILNQLFGVIGIRYLRLVDNDPLPNPATVLAIEGDSIKLADGRTIKIEREADYELRNRIQKSANRIGIETLGTSDSTLFVREPRFICGLGMPMITLPVIPINSPRYHKKMLAFGTIEREPNTNHD
jgi:hypothetical protein